MPEMNDTLWLTVVRAEAAAALQRGAPLQRKLNSRGLQLARAQRLTDIVRQLPQPFTVANLCWAGGVPKLMGANLIKRLKARGWVRTHTGGTRTGAKYVRTRAFGRKIAVPDLTPFVAATDAGGLPPDLHADSVSARAAAATLPEYFSTLDVAARCTGMDQAGTWLQAWLAAGWVKAPTFDLFTRTDKFPFPSQSANLKKSKHHVKQR